MSKKVESLVKGIAITGAAVGGSSVFSDANLVYASTSESLDVSNAPELVVNLEAKPTENVISAPASTTNVVAEPAATVVTSPVPQAEPEAQAEPEVQVEPEVQTDLEVQVEPELQADSESTPTDEELFASASESLSTENSELGSTSEFQSESLENTVSSLSQAESETASEYTSTSTAYSEANYDVEGLDELEDDVNEKLEREVEVRTNIENNNQLLTSSNYYNAERDDLAIAMIRYKLVQSGEITADYTISNAIDLGKNTNYLTNTLVYKYWQGSNYYEHHYCVKYVGVDGQYHEMYFDYATCDADGNTLIKNNLSDKNDDTPSNVDGVNIIIKTPIYNTVKMNGNYYQRVGFEAYDVTTTTGDTLNTVKGLDWYTKKQYLEDVSKRHSMSAAITSLSEAVISLANEMSETFVSASASAVVSESASEARYQSLTNSQIASTSASELKSESLAMSESIASSQSLSTSLSESASVSLAASEAANEDVVEPAAYSAAYTASVANNVISVTELDDSVEIANENVPAAGQAVATLTNHNADVFMPTIADNQVPLTVVEDVPEDETIESMFIGDNQVAKTGQALKARTGFIGFITIVIATITTKVGRDKMEKSPTK